MTKHFLQWGITTMTGIGFLVGIANPVQKCARDGTYVEWTIVDDYVGYKRMDHR